MRRRRGRGVGQASLRKDALNVIQGVGDDELEGSERRERRRRRCHARRVTTARGEEGGRDDQNGAQPLKRSGGSGHCGTHVNAAYKFPIFHAVNWLTLEIVTSFSGCTHRDMWVGSESI